MPIEPQQDLGALCRLDFPIFRDSNLIYLDSSATSQKPEQVIEAINNYHVQCCSNVHRGVYQISAQATELYEGARDKVARLIGARSREEIIFTRGATESINLVARAWGERFLRPGDEIITTVLEHHSNFVPWQQLAKARGVGISYIGLTDDGYLSTEELRRRLTERTKLVAVTQLANGLGVPVPVREIARMAHEVGALVLVDACQAVPHSPVNVVELDADFLVFSAHKLYGPTGTGVLYGRRAILDAMPPFLFGGDMIMSVSTEGTTFNELPYKFEAGTPNIAGVIGLAAAVDYVQSIGLQRIEAHEHSLVKTLERELAEIDGVEILGPAGQHEALVCFTVEGIHPHDLAQFLDARSIAVRAGHHCAQPLIKWFGVQSTTRASVGVYNTREDIAALATGIRDAVRYFR